MNIRMIIIGIIFFSGCDSQQHASSSGNQELMVRCHQSDIPCVVPFQYALSNPASLQDRKVRISGFLVKWNMSWLLVEDRLSANEGDFSGSFSIEGLDGKKLDRLVGQTVKLEGTFRNRRDRTAAAWGVIDGTKISELGYRIPPFLAPTIQE